MANLPEFNRRVLAHLTGEANHSGVAWKRCGYAFMVRHDGPDTVADGWSRASYDAACSGIDADYATVDGWIYLSDAHAAMTPVEG